MRQAHRHTIIGLAVVLASLLAIVLVAQQSPRELFERARLLEDSSQDLSEAVRLYGQVVGQAGGERALAATAQLRLGLLYERLGRDAEAQRAFTAVVTEYADQRDVVQQAQARIATTASNRGESGMVARRVWDGPGVDLEGAPSPDGSYLTYVDWSTGDLAIHTFASGEDRHLTNKGSWEDSRQYAGGSTPSPDGTLVAYGWNNADGFYELRIIGVDGSAPRVLYTNPAVPYLMPHAWSPDGTQILTMFVREDDSAQIVLVSVADGSVRVLKSQDWRWSNNKMSVSPDGRYIAYDFPPVEDAPERDLFLLATDGSREVPLVTHPANDLTPVWTPDGKTILFASDRTGGMALWAIDVAEGAPSGPARMVRTEMGQFFPPLGISAAGSYYYGQATGQVDLYVAPLDQTAGRPSASPVKLTQRIEGASRLPDWSPDGRRLAYVRGPGFNVQALTPSAPDDVIVIRSVDTGAERELRPSLLLIRGMGWSPDGDWLLLTGVGPQRRPGIYRVDIESGSTTLLLRKELIDVNPPSALPVVSPDGTTMFHAHHIGSGGGIGQFPGEGRILAHNLRTGDEREIYQAPANASITGLVLSPDGQQLAFSVLAIETFSGSLLVMPAAGGDAHQLYTSSGVARPLRWNPDGRGLFFGTMTPPGPGELWRISQDGGEPVRIDLQTDIIGDLSVHPDGRQVVFSAGEPAAEVWVLENLLAELDASARQ